MSQCNSYRNKKLHHSNIHFFAMISIISAFPMEQWACGWTIGAHFIRFSSLVDAREITIRIWYVDFYLFYFISFRYSFVLICQFLFFCNTNCIAQTHRQMKIVINIAIFQQQGLSIYLCFLLEQQKTIVTVLQEL